MNTKDCLKKLSEKGVVDVRIDEKGEAYRVNREFLSKIRDDFNIVISNIEEFKKEYPQIKNGFSLLGSVIATELCNNGIVTKTEEAGPYVFTIIPMIDDLTGEAKKWDV